MTRILLVDDNTNNLNYLETLLKAQGCEVMLARHGAEALTQARKNAPDLVISDLLMPVMDGYTLLRHWKADKQLKTIPFIVYTATYTETEDEQLAVNLGADAFILKPAEPEDFLARIRTIQENRLSATPASPNVPQADEPELLKVYSEALIRKLEEKTFQLEETNRALEKDLSERKKIEATLREQELKQQHLLGSLVLAQEVGKFGSWETDLKTMEVTWSEELFRIFEADPLHFKPTHQSFLDRVHPEDRAVVDSAFRDSIGRKGTFFIEHRILTSSGTVKHVEERWKHSYDEHDQPLTALGTCQDVTERRREEEHLRLLETCISHLNDSILITDAELDLPGPRILFVNEAFERLSGYSAAEVIGQSPRILQGPASDRRELKRIRTALRNRKPVRAEVVNYHKNGTPYWIEIDMVPVFSQPGIVTHFVAIQRDVTERKESELRLREALAEAERFRTALDHVPAHVYMKDPQSRYLYANRSTLQLFGCSAEEVVGARDEQFFPPATAEQLRAIDAKVFQGQQTTEEIDVPTASGKRQIFYEIKAPIYSDPEEKSIWGLLGISTDITENKLAEEALRESEQRFRQLAENINEVFWISDPVSQRILYVSPAFEKIWGHSCESLYESRELWLESIHPEDRERMAQASSPDELPKQAHDEIYRIIRPDQSIRWIRDQAFPVTNAQGEIYRVVGTAEDITERKRLETQTLRTQRMESIGNLAGGIAHDLNNMLAPILMALQILKMKIDDEEGLTILKTMQECAQRGADLVRQVLTFARGMDGRRLAVNLRHLSNDVQKIIRETFPKPIEFQVSYDKDLWSVMGDPTQLHQVLMNLCVNARDAMPHGGQLKLSIKNRILDEIYADMSPDAKPGNYVVIELSDTGTGIPPEIRDKIFEPFFTTKEPGVGTGLGLSTTIAIVKSHGGFMNLYSELNVGTTFKVYLPADASLGQEESQASEELRLPRGNGEMILVVDDEAGIRAVARKTLERYGYFVLLAGNGAEAVALYAQNRGKVAVVLTDMAMPVMDGIATITAIRAMDPGAKIIGSSGLADNAMAAKAVSCGVRHFIPKPYTAEAILQTIRLILTGETVFHPGVPTSTNG